MGEPHEQTVGVVGANEARMADKITEQIGETPALLLYLLLAVYQEMGSFLEDVSGSSRVVEKVFYILRQQSHPRGGAEVILEALG
jgi:hypothetical protein